MRYRPFGRTGLSVSVVGFGCWPMAGDRYGAIEDDEAVKAIHRALERGVNCVDTAPAYGGGHSEEVVGRALAGRREDVILVTKCGVRVPPPGQPGPVRDSSPANILREIDASLKRLRTDWVDVLLVHWPDAATPGPGSASCASTRAAPSASALSSVAIFATNFGMLRDSPY
jgi:aryl-alcohol dehydrogenase-like predicted oxidoreductase